MPSILAKEKIIECDGVIFQVRSGTHDELVIEELLSRRALHKRVEESGALSFCGNLLDVGGHIGAFSIPLVKFGLAKKVYCFEPDGSNYLLLKKNIQLNNVAKFVRVFQKAVAGKNGIERFYSREDGRTSCSSFLTKGFPKCSASVFVETMDINTILSKFSIDFIKLDCEGKEVEIVQSINDWHNVKGISIEYHFSMLRKGRSKEEVYKDYLNFLDLLRNHFSIVVSSQKKPTGAWFTNVYARK